MGCNDQTSLTEGSLQLALLMLSREFSGMIHWLTMNHPSNPQQPPATPSNPHSIPYVKRSRCPAIQDGPQRAVQGFVVAHRKFPTPSGAPPGSRGNLKMFMISMVDTQSLGVSINGVLHMVNIWFIYIYIRFIWII